MSENTAAWSLSGASGGTAVGHTAFSSATADCTFDRAAPFFFFNSSAFHNAHHAFTVTHFGEVGTFWDWVLGTDGKRQINLDGNFEHPPLLMRLKS